MTKNDNKILVIVLIVVLAFALFVGFGIGNPFGNQYYFDSGFGLLFAIIALLCAIWVIYDVVVNNKGLSDGMKVLWVVCAVLFNILTAIIYFLIGRDNQNDLFRKNRRIR